MQRQAGERQERQPHHRLGQPNDCMLGMQARRSCARVVT